jgi:CBS-domain-containing membrane protein
MKHTKLVLGCLEKTQINKTRVRDYSVQELRRLRSLDDPSLKLVRTEDLESIVEDAVMMYFIPTRQDLVRHQVETRDRVYAGMVRRNDDIAQFRSSMA